MLRTLVFLYGAFSYLMFFVTFLYMIGFIGNFIVPKSIDTPPSGPLTSAVLVNSLLLLLFGLQHSVMARPRFKRWWTRIIPEPVERSTYVLFSSLVLLLLFWKWRAMPGVVWDVSNTAGQFLLNILFWLGWAIMLASTILTNHFDLFGLRQVCLHQRGIPYTALGFRTPLFYRIVRHPINLGFIIAFWSTPRMTTGHLLFAVGSTVYILLGSRLEERDLLNLYGETYKAYQRDVSMLLPVRKRSFNGG